MLVLLLLVLAGTTVGWPRWVAVSPDDAAAARPDNPGSEDRPGALSWAPPPLDNPAHVRPTPGAWLRLDPQRDYIVDMPDEPYIAAGGLRIQGGRNVVIVGGEVRIPEQGPSAGADERKAVRLKEQTGTVHLEGLLLAGDVTEGIQLDQRHASTVQIENVRVETIRARDEVGFSDNHPDLIQTWAGPDRLRIDRFTGTSDYQGFFFHPTQYGASQPRSFELRHVNIAGTSTARYLLWRVGDWPLTLRDVWVKPAPGRSLAHTLWPHGDPTWASINEGSPPAGDFVPEGVAGASYVSPGYVGSSGHCQDGDDSSVFPALEDAGCDSPQDPSETPAPSPTPSRPVTPPSPPVTPQCNGKVATIVVATPNASTTGTEGDDVVVGSTGDDTIDGRGGNDKICGGGGNDRISGNKGDDEVSGGEGSDTLSGNQGTDTLEGDAENDTLNGDAGNDRLLGGEGDDEVLGGSANDQLIGGAGQDRLFGEDGNDRLFGENGDDRLSGGNGDDQLSGGEGADHLEGGPDIDRCDGGPGSNSAVDCER